MAYDSKCFLNISHVQKLVVRIGETRVFRQIASTHQFLSSHVIPSTRLRKKIFIQVIHNLLEKRESQWEVNPIQHHIC